MSSTVKPNLPPNPYTRQPIKKREHLAGRGKELKTIRYYLNLTASGHSPHIALIGHRGVGKTSLLNEAEAISKDLKLLPVRLDMNELKANSPGRFWHDLYFTLIQAMVKVGCWGGEQGIIYEALFQMMCVRKSESLDKAVLKIPFAYSCHQGSLDTFECVDSLVIDDFKTCVLELISKKNTGIVFLIDEADCLGKNVPLLQMFRNIFQTVDRCSLLLAGTEAVFPVLSEVFSPIPRQFHRIDIKSFAHWVDTRELVLRPLAKEIHDDIAPKWNVTMELHELCGGEPAEVQLYCHHMYRSVEDGVSKRLSLSPQVFREVLREYRANTPANVDSVLNAIESLPDKLLFESKWLSQKNLTLDENIRVEVLRKELKEDRLLTPSERDEIACELKEGYRKLFAEGITESENCLYLSGAPLTAGFWKSFVEAERAKRWKWNEQSFVEILWRLIVNKIASANGADGFFEVPCDDDARPALQFIRESKSVTEFSEGMGEMVVTALVARDKKVTWAIDVAMQLNTPTGKHSACFRFFEMVEENIGNEHIEKWIEDHTELLADNEIAVLTTSFTRWLLPTEEELHRLGRISGLPLPSEFGPSAHKKALSKFGEGDIQGCADEFSRILIDKESADVRNNLAFCQLYLGQVDNALENATKAVSLEYEPLYEMNKGLAEFLQGNVEDGKQSLRQAFEQFQYPDKKFDPSTALYVLILEVSKSRVDYKESVPIDAAILINLSRMGELADDELVSKLETLYPDKIDDWRVEFGMA